MAKGGKREGAGRPKKSSGEKRAFLGCRITPCNLWWIKREIDRTGKNSGELIDLALEVLQCLPDRQFPGLEEDLE